MTAGIPLGTSLADDGFLGFVRRKLATNRFESARLCFEITETGAISVLSRAREVIGDICGFGFSDTLDEFGSGPSPFSSLRDFPVDHIKFDGEFARATEKTRPGRAAVDAVAAGHAPWVSGPSPSTWKRKTPRRPCRRRAWCIDSLLRSPCRGRRKVR